MIRRGGRVLSSLNHSLAAPCQGKNKNRLLGRIRTPTLGVGRQLTHSLQVISKKTDTSVEIKKLFFSYRHTKACIIRIITSIMLTNISSHP